MNTSLAIASLLLTVLVFEASKRLHRRFRYALLSPMLVTPLVLIAILLLTRLPYATYNAGGQWLTYLLKPATVAFAVPMYKHFHLLKKHAPEIIASVVVGSFVAIVTTTLFAGALHQSGEMIVSMAPRSVTTPIAMDISAALGGVPTLTAVFVMITGISGMILGPYFIRFMPIRTSIAKGVFFGMGAHGAGTSKAFEFGELEGTVSSLAMILAGGASLLLAPMLVPLMEKLVA